MPNINLAQNIQTTQSLYVKFLSTFV